MYIICDIIVLHVWYQELMISSYVNDIRAHITKILCMISEMISSMISYMISRCLYPPLKTRCIERCRSHALQVQVQDVQNQWRWSSGLLDEARLVLGVRRIQTGNVRHRVPQSVIVLGRWAPHQARPVFIVVRQSQHRWKRLCCSADAPGAGAGMFFWKLNTQPARIHVLDWHSNWI